MNYQEKAHQMFIENKASMIYINGKEHAAFLAFIASILDCNEIIHKAKKEFFFKDVDFYRIVKMELFDQLVKFSTQLAADEIMYEKITIGLNGHKKDK